ncbi:zinc finger, C3HC4 type (RING finger) protein (macronuclear) [Tetrahymena thermophila SB210]|uniref:Zinc finger, C3HC4 type (RING finger) protein n=1 Tax=Tetrahymena thermophila (strain SB210) TaxID=312017 RepID=I7M947_TETTS|nr:zinc finger, C3HC4 type (RING finger) protein [Tetrahymena thermophila SB210]EAS00774.1 zinc finger, C3HC4 type (RING finger) protein [Tetrahymena thermophila SB210]|eukprot:XP_001021019.1 zinc finger, C3HC4 type (RING finger) protein [Tetrahymena thermophila SB210]
MFKILVVALALIKFIIGQEDNFQISLNKNVSQQIKFYTQNHTIGFQVDWGQVEQTVIKNTVYELVIDANVTHFPSSEYQIPFLCISNKTATSIVKQKDMIAPKVIADYCDFYSYRTNQGQYRIIFNSEQWFIEAQYYLSFLNITSLQIQTLDDFDKIPVGNIKLNNNGTLLDNNYWIIDVNIGLYQVHTKQFGCNSQGEYNLTLQQCTCNPGFAGMFCEFIVEELSGDVTQNAIIQPYKYQSYKFTYNNYYNLVIELNNTATFNYFFCDQTDTEDKLQRMFIQTFQYKSLKLQYKRKQQVVPLPYNETINCIYFWFKNDNVQQLELEITMKEANQTFLDQFIQILISYLFYTLIGGVFFCGCSFCIVYFSSEVYKRWTKFMRRRQMEKQLPLMTYSQFKQNQNLHRNNDQNTCSICLGEYEDNDRIRVTCCRHVFHQECIEEWALKKNQCPFCREKIFIFLYNSMLELLKRNTDRNNQQINGAENEQNNSEEQNNSANEIQVNVQMATLNIQQDQPNSNRYQNLVETN